MGNVSRLLCYSWCHVFVLRKLSFELTSSFAIHVYHRGNIPGKAVQAGQELCHYLPPFPARGTGFHRYIYVLFKQDAQIDFKEDVRPLQWWANIPDYHLQHSNYGALKGSMYRSLVTNFFFCELCKRHWADVSPSVIPLKIVHSTH